MQTEICESAEKKMMQEEKIRLNKYMAQAGLCSRREADKLIEQGRVYVNGTVAGLGCLVGAADKVQIGKKEIKGAAEKVLIAFYKPVGVTCTEKDRFADKKILDYVKTKTRVTYAGRLDKDSEGLMLLTNDGELIQKLMRGAEKHEKEYVVKVEKEITPEFLEKMAGGIYLEELDRTTRPCRVTQEGKYTFRIILTQGLNRQIRRMCEYFGYRVQKLVRVRIMNIELGDLESGKYRDVTPEEFKKLKQLITHSSNQPVRPMEKPQKSKRKPRNSAIHGTYTVVNHHIDRENKNGNRKATD